ncbi:MAG TPA: CoA transferase subunit A, partial [Halieaceae bacterium]|nr:CoA transferase subunit A [Halieaceae bacterium]
GSPGTPFGLLAELERQGQRDLTIIKNDANEAGIGVSRLIEAGQVRRLITSHIDLNKRVVALMNSGELAVDFHPQGILAEKIRCAGAGCLAFLSDIGLHSEITDPGDVIEWRGRPAKVEAALTADFALLHAERADSVGNLCYRATARNFSPLMAMAADCVIVEAAGQVPAGSIDPDQVHTPGAFVDAVTDADLSDPAYGLMEGRYAP